MEEQDITREFLDAMIGVRKASKIPHFFSELSYSELAVFRAMRFLSGGCLPKELVKTSDISAHIQISKPALSQVINKLEDKAARLMWCRLGTANLRITFALPVWRQAFMPVTGKQR